MTKKIDRSGEQQSQSELVQKIKDNYKVILLALIALALVASPIAGILTL